MFVRVVLPLVVLGLMVYSLADLAGSEEEDRGGLPTWLWVLIIILLPVFGAVAWIVLKQQRRRSGGLGQPGRGGRPGRGPRRPSGPVAPDDDPDFLWRLEQERRRRRRESGESPDDEIGDGPASPA
jgi:hypothetical protein